MHTHSIVGVGAVGSFVALNLIRLGIPFDCYDFDIVEEKNLKNQAYELAHIGLPKVEALRELCYRIDPVLTSCCTFNNCKVSSNDVKPWIGNIFLMVDSIVTRRELAQRMKKVSNIVEARLGGESGRVLSFTPHMFDIWKETIFDPTTAHVSECGTKKDLGFVAQHLACLALIVYKTIGTEQYINDLNYSVYNLENITFKW